MKQETPVFKNKIKTKMNNTYLENVIFFYIIKNLNLV